jgi:tetratricopeptide (TPR) repeat protein
MASTRSFASGHPQGATGTTDGSGRGMISLVDKTWGVVFDLPGFEIQINETKPDGRRYMFAINKTSGVDFSATLEEVDPARNLKDCKKDFEGRAKHSVVSMTNTRIWESGDKTYFDYSVPMWGITPVNQGNRSVCEVHDNVYIDVHLSKPSFQPGDEKLFDQIIDSMSFQEGVTRTALEYLQGGGILYMLRHNNLQATRSLEQALELEKEKPQLEKKYLYVLVDTLGTIYGTSGNPEKARETFEYGIRRDPDYPLFYYELACYYGEKLDTANALDNLQKAFDRRANDIPGETMPDPLKDKSFKILLKDKAFRSKIVAIVKRP